MPVSLLLAGLLLGSGGCANYASVTFGGPDYPSGPTRPAKLLERGDPGPLKVQTVRSAKDFDLTARCDIIVMADGTLLRDQCVTIEAEEAPEAFGDLLFILGRVLYRTRAEPALLEGKPVSVRMSAKVHFIQDGEDQALSISPLGRFNDQGQDLNSIGAQRVLVAAGTEANAESACGPYDSLQVSGVIGVDGVARDLSFSSNAIDSACEADAIERIKKHVYVPAFDGEGNAVESRLEHRFLWALPGGQSSAYDRRDRDAKQRLRIPPQFPLPGSTKAPVPTKMRGSQSP
ncbi:MAG: hypothetical protein AB8G17_15530 [Gammaproteobacteria bacterium]